eukprot:370841-Pelagomonas_calceolata.AAC.3
MVKCRDARKRSWRANAKDEPLSRSWHANAKDGHLKPDHEHIDESSPAVCLFHKIQTQACCISHWKS